VRLEPSVIFDSAGTLVGVIGASTDISEHRHTSDAVARTKVQLSDAQHIAREGGLVALLLIDLDRCRVVIDGHGHSAGDVIWRQCAAHVAKQIRPTDTLARLGGEEFVVLLDSFHDEGTETPELLAKWRDLGCDLAPGYLRARPPTAPALRRLMLSAPRW